VSSSETLKVDALLFKHLRWVKSRGHVCDDKKKCLCCVFFNEKVFTVIAYSMFNGHRYEKHNNCIASNVQKGKDVNSNCMYQWPDKSSGVVIEVCVYSHDAADRNVHRMDL